MDARHKQRQEKHGQDLGADGGPDLPAAQAYLAHNRKAFPVLKALGNLLVIDDEHCRHEEKHAQEQSQEEEAAVQLQVDGVCVYLGIRRAFQLSILHQVQQSRRKGALLFLGDRLWERMERRAGREGASSRRRALMLMSSITLHNIPEGLSVGVAFGSLAYGLGGATPAAACLLALGIGIQNLPEGTAVSVPLRREGMSRGRAFFLGQLSGIVEPISGVLGALLVLKVRLLLPYMLAFAAGAMIYVVVEELIPESQTNERKDVMALFTLIGFSVMMVLDVALG